MKKPKTLYRFDHANKRLYRWEVRDSQLEYCEMDFPGLMKIKRGWCPNGYATILEAKKEALEWAREDLNLIKNFIRKLTKGRGRL